MKKPQKLVMTLLVRDEEDIIEKNINFHLQNGVDFIIATDNGSKDGTRNILLNYEKKGFLQLIDEPIQDHFQSKRVNRMGKIAFEKYGADIIFHCDADEFWYPEKGDLKEEMLNSGVNVLVINLINILLEDKNKTESFPGDTKYAVIKPLETENFEEDSKRNNLYFFKYPPKVMFRTTGGLFEVTEGNHSVSDIKNSKIEFSQNIRIYHFPLRGEKHFFNKVRSGGRALASNKHLSEKIGWHWRRWYDAYENSRLDEEYKKLVITKEKASELMAKGMIEPFDFQKFISEK